MSASHFDDPPTEGGATEESGGEDGGADSGTAGDTTSGEDALPPVDTGEADTTVTPDSLPPPEDTFVPPPDTTPPPVDAPMLPCTEPSAQMFNGHCYIPLKQRDWYTAKSFCATNLHGHLVTITSDAEQNFLDSFFTSTERWIGMSRDASSMSASAYKWVDGESVSFTNWASGEPNFSGSCVRMLNTGEWADQDCMQSLYGICERE